jgi:poly(3-hydroxybutyrate) depolymerase
MRIRTKVVGLFAPLALLTSPGCSDSTEDTPGSAGTGQAGHGMSMAGSGTVGGSSGAGAAQAGSSAAGTTAGTSAAGGANGGGSASGGASNGGSSSGGAPKGGSSSSGGSGGGALAGAGGGGGGAPKPSQGCNQATSQTLNQWVESMVMTSGANRPYSVRLPTGYDKARSYPLVVLLHGCSGGTNNVPMEKVTGSDAILIRGTGSAANTCWETSATGKDVAFFDSMVADAKARFCVDESHVFIVGYSSGSWLVNQLTCIRADVVRGGASVSGGESSNGKCGGPVGRIFLHDTTDMDNQISGSERARDRQLTQNACDKAQAPVAVAPSPCTLYPGCPASAPVEWCPTSGKAHGRQDDLAPGLFWNFFKTL